MPNVEGSIAGKNIITYTSRGGKKYSSDDIRKYLGNFKLCDALRLIGELSNQIFRANQGLHIIEDVPVFDGVLAYLSMRLIESSNDYRSKDMTLDNLLTAIDMFFGIPDPFEDGGDNPQGCLIRFGASQFDYDREARHLLPRTLIIYRDLWNTVTSGNQVDINAAIHNFSGLTLQEMLVLSFVFLGKSENGFFRLDKEIDNYPNTLKNYCDIEKQKNFIKWISCNYKEFRSQLITESPLSIEYEKFRFNPLSIKPVIIPDRNPQPGFSQVYIAPIPTLIYEKVTRGIYFSLSDHFKIDRSNIFKGAFGDVFQEYVGLLLKKTCGKNNVKKEWRYGSGKNLRDTPDWFVIKDGVAILIEVKQSGLYLNAKQWGNREDIQKNLAQTIGSGMNQMWRFENDVKSESLVTPDWFNNIEITERVIVIYDSSYFLNSILRDEVRQLYPSVIETYHWHTIAVEELEYFLGIVGDRFVEALTEKRLDSAGDTMDFRDYYARKFAKDDFTNPYLSGVYDKFFSDLGVECV